MTHDGARDRSAVGASLLVATVLMLSSIVATAYPARAAELSDAAARAFADVAACAAQSDHLLAAVVVDSSGSLRQTDPGDLRVGAIQTALDSLEQLGTTSQGALDVQASVATFGARYEQLVGWGPVSGGHVDALRQATSEELPGRDNDNFTDYRAALSGAQQSLEERAAALDGTSCKVVLWFTDGRLDVDGTGRGPATEAARAELCEPQGLLDRLRRDGVAVIALALFTEGGQGSVTDEDRERLRAVAEGTGSAGSCGTAPIPASAAGGAYLPADDAAAMRRLFAQAGALIEGGTAGTSVACPEAPCVGGQLTIPVDRGIGGFRAVLERDRTSVLPQLVAPDGSSHELVPGTAEVGGATLAVTDRDGLMVVNAVFPGSGSTGGAWTLVTDPSGTTLVDLYYFWGVSLTIEAPDGVLVGEGGAISVVPRHGDGSVVDPSELTSVDVAVTVDGVDHTFRAGQDGRWELDVEVPPSDVPPSLHVEATARALSSPSGIALGPVSAAADVVTTFPPSFPTVSPAMLELPAVVGDGNSTGTLTFTGSERGPTRACFESPTVQAPELAGEVVIAPASECVDIPAGAEISVPVDVQAASPADGRVDGVLPVLLEGVDGGEPIRVEVPFGVSMSRPVDEGTRWLLIAAFTLGALAFAGLTAELARRRSDRYRLGTDARAASVPVIATASGVRRAQPEGGMLLDPAFDFEPVGLDRERSLPSFETRGLVFGRSFGWFPLSPGRASVRDSGGAVIAAPSRDSVMLEPDGSRAPAEFPGAVGFVLVAEPPADADRHAGLVRGRLVVVVDSREGVAAALPDRLDEIASAPWDRIVDAVQRAHAVRTERGTTTRAGRGGARTSSESPGPDGAASLGAPVGGAGAAWGEGDAVPANVTAPPPGLRNDWHHDDDADTAPTDRAPSAKTGRTGRLRKRPSPSDEHRRGEAPHHTSPPGRSDDPPLPPSINFWD